MKNLVMFSSIFADQEIGFKISKMSKNGYGSKICFIPAFTTNSDVSNSHVYKDFVEMGFSGKNISMFDVCFKFDESQFYKIKNADIIVLGGGNTFLFQWLLKERKVMPILSEIAEQGKVFVGESAGSIMMSNIIDISQYADKDIVCSENHDGIGISPIEVKPHFQAWYNKFELFVLYSQQNNDVPLYCLEDGMCIIVEDDTITAYGESPFVLISGKVYYENIDVTKEL